MSLKINQICRKASLLVAFLLFLQAAKAQTNYAGLEKAVESKRAALGNDFVVMIAGKDSILYSKDYGTFNQKTPVLIAAASKWLTTALVMMYVDEGKISLDDKISKWLPIFDSYSKGYITIRHCLSHQTGIETDGISLRSLLGRKKWASLEEEVADFAKKEIKANAGEEFRYSNMGLNIAARVIEVVTKKKFETLIRSKLFTPLGMKSTTFAMEDASAPNPSGGAKSTAADYTKFLQMLLNGGKAAGRQFLSEAAIADMRKVQVSRNQIKYTPKGAEGLTYTLGAWVVEGKDAVGSTATALASPGLFGTWPMVDFERGYACLFFSKNLLNEQKPDAFLELKKEVDKAVPGNRK